VSEHGRAWLAARSGAVPTSLAAQMELAVKTVPASDPPDIPGELTEAALSCLQRAFEDCDRRPAALHLLAADALITSACEAAAEEGSHALAAVLEAVSLARLETLLPTPPVAEPPAHG
jgi:hypothetical protein